MNIRTGRPVTLAPHGMVTSPHSLASAVGIDVLRSGGSAIDAAIAASAVLAVVYPHMTGLGGDAFWLVHDGRSGEVKYLNGGGKAASRASLASLEKRGLNEIPLQGIIPATLTVPGAVASWIEAHDAYGSLHLSRVLESAIGYAREGFPVTGRLASFIEMMRDDLMQQSEAAAYSSPTVRYRCRGPSSQIRIWRIPFRRSRIIAGPVSMRGLLPPKWCASRRRREVSFSSPISSGKGLFGARRLPAAIVT